MLLVLLAAAVATIAPTVGTAQSVTLRPLADDVGLNLGAAVDAEGLADSAYRQLLADHVNLVSTRGDLSMAVVQPEPGVFDFDRIDAVLDFAVDNDMVVRGHELIDGSVPAWVGTASWTADTLSQVLRDHVAEVIGYARDRNPGVIIQWDVVGDAFLPDGTPRPTIWQQVIGDDYILIAFEAARAADPDALLFYDDFYDDLAITQDAVASGVAIVPGANAERSTCDVVPKCVGIRDRIASLVADGAPIDGIGLQSHLFSPDPADFTQLTSWVGELGLVWAVTEFDVPLPVTEIDSSESLEFQAGVYAAALAACADAAECDTFVTWGITDRFSPIPAETGGVFGGALWFDQNDAAKPAFDAMADVLTERGAPATTVPPDSVASSLAATTIESGVTPTTDEGSDGGGGVVVVLIGLAALGVIAVVIVAARRRGTQESASQ
jgi:endo-1,4-beta-xylanase